MKTIADIITEAQAILTTPLSGVADAVQQVITDLQAIVPVPPAADPVVEVDVKTQSGTDTVFVPKV